MYKRLIIGGGKGTPLWYKPQDLEYRETFHFPLCEMEDCTFNINADCCPDVVGDCRDYNFKNIQESFESIVCECLPCFALTQNFLKNAGMVLKPGGRLYILTGRLLLNKQEEFVNDLSLAGFNLLWFSTDEEWNLEYSYDAHGIFNLMFPFQVVAEKT